MIRGTTPWPASLRAACFLLLQSAISPGAATLPAGFTETRIAEGLNPTTMTFAPDGRLFLCEKQGLLRVIDGGKLLPEPVLDIRAKVDAWNERGLLSVCFDPDFTRNGWIYVYYTHNRKPEDKARTNSNNRVSRFTVKGNSVAANSEVVLLELSNLSKIGWHNGGGLAFGKDGKLYVSTGENSVAPNAQDPGNLLGKLLRLNKDGSIPQDNPHYKEFKGENRAIVALGLRNPFSIAVQMATGLLYLSEVGANYEQLEAYDTGAAPVGTNYGWPDIDGPLRNQAKPEGYRAPAYPYDHGRGEGLALCSGDFYNPNKPGTEAFPPEYIGRFFFSDYKGWIKAIDPAKPDTRHDFATGINRPIDVEIAPDGALWYIERAGIPGGSDEANSASTNGSLWRVVWSGGGKPAKLAIIQQPVSTDVGAPLGEVKVALQDATGKTIDTANDTITLTLEGAAPRTALSGPREVAALKGVATFSPLSIGRPGRGYSLRASSGGLGSTSSSSFDISDRLAAPLITPPAGSFTGPVWVRISSPAPGTTIRFTTDGKAPDASSPAYTEPFEVTGDTTVQAIVQREGLTDSAAVSASMKITGSTPYSLDLRPIASGVKLPASAAEGMPPTLSGTGIFRDKTLSPAVGMVPYSLNAPSWADGAETQRWVILPGEAKIGFAPTGEYTWPGGTIFVQHFEIVTDKRSKTRRRLETRLLVLDATGSFGYGASYRWRADGSDADLVDAAGAEEVLQITDAAGVRKQSWTYPGSSLCYLCHTPNAGFVLGPKTRQLNGTHSYPGGRSDNQLRTWNYLQMFDRPLDESAIASYPRCSAIDDAEASLEDRVRSYIDSNCAHCHRPNGTGALWDARFDTPLASQGILNGEVRNNFGVENGKVVLPGDPTKSMLHRRMASTSLAEQMPPMTRNVVDQAALDLIAEWIRAQAPAKEETDR
ncbi:PQQ-dependent sugar dehydrogenase [Luteolibacter sp. GHJ8]|uniref:PQQ-dependent sugar dehydrogenase n=1 Tax=Luteolibacter rhizosphaerae TaxID=2989719 RepID=A0ABT3G896_9BACT|nr:PQQ-dependent sugar dehydrogenase [Luteolibacter rhizosphaerae]MCW1915689.1 PQQ-dependent sugar dehydrogenase [Luteolibacter rhizosphaerae]